MRVIKVGGSLYDLPDLGPRLVAFLATGPAVVVPGGGMFADAVRTLDRIHRLGDEHAHGLAVRAMLLAGEFLSAIAPGCDVIDPAGLHRACRELPASWQVTSDSIAVAVARSLDADELLLLKSAEPPDGCWSAGGYVDPHFPSVARSSGIKIGALSFRDWRPGSRVAARRYAPTESNRKAR